MMKSKIQKLLSGAAIFLVVYTLYFPSIVYAYSSAISMTVVPESAPINTPRTISVTYAVQNFCNYPTAITLDSSMVDTNGTLSIGFDYGVLLICALSFNRTQTFVTTYTPVKAGDLTVRARDGDASATALIKTVDGPRIRSKFDVTGLWWDPSTSGSGLSIIHSYSTTDVAVVSWYAHTNGAVVPYEFPPQRLPPTLSARWFSVQGLQWTEDGSVLEGGAAYTVGGSTCPVPLLPMGVGLADCPSKSSTLTAFARLRIKFESAKKARAEAILPDGKTLFIANIVPFDF